jgi:hypothetical protein
VAVASRGRCKPLGAPFSVQNKTCAVEVNKVFNHQLVSLAAMRKDQGLSRHACIHAGKSMVMVLL